MIAAPIVLVHGALGCAREVEPLAAALRYYGDVRTPEFIGHGGRALPETLTIDAIARDLVEYLDREAIGRALFVGYSLGGYVALYLARHFPERVAGAVSIAGKFRFDEATVKHWSYLADPDRLRSNGRALVHEKNHAPQDWIAVARMNSRLFAALGREPELTEADLAAIAAPVMLISSDRDQLVPWSETTDMRRRIPRSHYAMFYGSAHPLPAIPLHPVARAIDGWAHDLS
jgi:pimeloyl-ACP methyl ester carboxylesterase